jgi:hypothetical protein
LETVGKLEVGDETGFIRCQTGISGHSPELLNGFKQFRIRGLGHLDPRFIKPDRLGQQFVISAEAGEEHPRA